MHGVGHSLASTPDMFYQAAFRAYHFRKQKVFRPEQAVRPGVVVGIPFTTEHQTAVEGPFLLWQEQR